MTTYKENYEHTIKYASELGLENFVKGHCCNQHIDDPEPNEVVCENCMDSVLKLIESSATIEKPEINSVYTLGMKTLSLSFDIFRDELYDEFIDEIRGIAGAHVLEILDIVKQDTRVTEFAYSLSHNVKLIFIVALIALLAYRHLLLPL